MSERAARLPSAPRRTGVLARWTAELNGLPPPGGPGIALLCFRSLAWLRWSVYAACQVYRLGHRPVLLFSGGEMNERLPEQWRQVRQVPQFEFVDVDADFDRQRPASDLPHRYLGLAGRAARLAAAHELRIEAEEAYRDPDGRRLVERLAGQLPALALACERALQRSGVSRAACPSGLIGWSGAFLAAARKLGLPCTCVEQWTVREGHMIWNLDRPAVQHDVSGWAQVYASGDPSRERQLESLTSARQHGGPSGDGWLEGFHNAQQQAASGPLPDSLERFLRRPGPHFLLGPNVVGDSVTLGRETIFASQREWLQATCRFFRQHPELNLTVRAHPDEVTRPALHVRLADVARAASAGAENIHCVDSSSPLNTFAIAERAQAGLVWTSTLGADLVLRGKPVLVAADAPYLQLQVGMSATSRDDYFRKLLHLASNPAPPDARAVAASRLYVWMLFGAMSLPAAPLPGGGVATGEREHERFYRMLIGELDARARPWPAGGRPPSPAVSVGNG